MWLNGFQSFIGAEGPSVECSNRLGIHYSLNPTMDSIYVFDPAIRALRRARAATAQQEAGWLFDEGAAALADRLAVIRRRFDRVIFHGTDFAALARALPALRPQLCLDGEREIWPEAAAGADLVLSNLQLHWVNDLPGLLVQIRRALRPDGFFSACLLGGETLFELRACLLEAEEQCGRAHAPRVSPMMDLPTAAGLMQRAGFALPVVDHEVIRVAFAQPLRLLKDLRALGQANALGAQDRRILPRAFWPTLAQIYAARFPDGQGGVTATFDVIFLSGWSPAASQPRPLRQEVPK